MEWVGWGRQGREESVLLETLMPSRALTRPLNACSEVSEAPSLFSIPGRVVT